MKLPEILELLQERNISIDVEGDELIARASSGIIDSEVIKLLKLNKRELLDTFRHGITPAMLPLVDLTQTEIDRIVATVPQGIENVQDIYPLAPLQEGILFHHLLATEGDLYLSRVSIAFDSRRRLDQFISTLQAVIDRHDILRTAVLWKEFSQPVQVVYRKALLSVNEVDASVNVLEQLWARLDPCHVRLDLQRAPLLAAYTAYDLRSEEWFLVLLIHHLVCDHVAIGLILAEIQALLQGHGDRLPPALPYRNFISQARSVSSAEHEAYFRACLRDIDQPTAPFGLLDVQGDAGGITEARLPLSEKLSQRIRDIARRRGVTAAVLFHVAWAQVVALCSCRDDVVFGTVLFGRLQGSAGADQVLGMFINTLPIRIPLANRPARDVVADTYQQLSELLIHEHASLSLAQRCSGVPAAIPLFAALLNYRHTHIAAKKPNAAATAWEGIRLLTMEERSNYPITMIVDDLGQGFSMLAQCIHGVNPARMTAYLQNAVESLVTALAEESRQPLLSLPVLPAQERHQLLVEWNATATAHRRDQLVHQVFAAQAVANPDAVALRYEELVLSYAQLNAKADRLARYLLDASVMPGARVGVHLSRSPELIIAVLGVLKAGSAYVPLDPKLPKERLSHMMRDAGISCILLESATMNDLPLQGVDVVLMDGAATEEVWLDDHSQGALPTVAVTDLAYVIYTSGSTGQPKGVMVEHRGLSNYLAHAVETYLPGLAGSVVSSPLSFDATLTTLLPPLLVGKPVWLLPDDAHTLARLSERLFAPGEGWLFKLTPAHLEALSYLERGVASGLAPHCIVVGGEQLASATLQRWKGELLPHASFVNEYGPTETVVGCSVWALATAGQLVGLAGSAAAPIGQPIRNTQLYVLGSGLQLLPTGSVGELYIAGVQVARGYLNRPDLTRERFLPDPFSAIPQARMYKTGDLCRYLPDGNLVFLGRNDFQVNIRGFRIEPGDIEAQLLAYHGVREAVVIAREDTPGEKRLVAYLVIQEGAELSVARLRAQLASALAEYMLPAAYVTLSSLPFTPNGKLDRRALPVPEADAYLKRTYEAPTGEVEIAIAVIWQDLLHVQHVGRHDHFFELGGHSLLAVQLVSRLRQVLGVDVVLRDLFATPTLAALARRVAAATALVLPPIQPTDRTQNLPLSWAQQRLWFLAQLDPAASAAYHIPAAFHLQGSLDRAALTATLDRVVARHEILRTTFVKADEGEPAQVIASADTGFALSQCDLRNLTESERRAAVGQLTEDEFRHPFDLEGGPLIRGQLLQLDDDDHILLFCQHHIISDGWSIGILGREITTLYAAFTQKLPDPLPPLSLQYADYALWQRQWLLGETLQTQIEFWRQQLAGAPALLELPTDHPRPATQSFAGASIPLVLPADLTAALQASSRRHSTTVFMTLLAGWSILLARSSGQNDLVIGTSVANRQRLEIESLIGFFVNTLALRIKLDDNPTVTQLLARIKTTTLAAYAHQDVPFEQVVEAVQPVRTLSHSSLFQAFLSLDNTPAADTPALPGLQLAPVPAPRTTTQFDLLLSLVDTGEVIRGELSYASDLFERPTIERLVGHFQTVLRAMIADESQGICELALLTDAEQHRLLVEWNATTTAYAHDQLIHQLFEAQAAAQPDATALVYQDQSLTYGELNAKANQLAHHLLSLGIRPDDRVALCVERGLEMVVGLLGILKAGAAYVPLDPSSPEARLAFMLTDCAPVALLTQATPAEHLPAMSMLRVVILDDPGTEAVIARYPSDNLEPRALGLTPSHLAYVIYTSGSTGSAKGVMVEHHCAVNFWQVLRDTTHRHCPPQAHIGLNAAYFFDMSLKGLLQLLSGHRLVIIPQPVRADGAVLLRFLEQHHIDAFDCTPSQLDLLLAAGLLDSPYQPKSVLIGGEAIDTTTWRRLGRTPIHFYNMYGPTECTVDATIGLVSGPNPHIGRPVANTAMYLLDAYGQPVPIGVTGEIYIGGVQVARGYLNRPDLTRERFLPDPFSATPQARMYKTGDLGRYLPDGNIMFLGRNDFQVKLRGFRVELGEIEAQLLACRGVREAVVIAREDTPGDWSRGSGDVPDRATSEGIPSGDRGEKRLVAYLVAEQGAELSVAQLRAQLASVLAEYMVPAAYVTLPSLPLTSNGKLDRNALPAPEADAYLKRTYEAPTGEIEIAIAAIWQELLHVQQIGRHDHFFELGGHSLLAVETITRMRQIGLHVAIRALFVAPTLMGLAGVTEKIKRITL